MEYQIECLSNDKIDQLVIDSQYCHNSLSIVIPYSFIRRKISISWNDLFFFINNGYLKRISAIEYAIDNLSTTTSDKRVIRLACSDEYDTLEKYFMMYVEELANEESLKQKELSKDKVLFVVLSWLYDNRIKIENPIRVLDILFDDFDYPLLLQKTLDNIHGLDDQYRSNEYIYNMWYTLINQIQDHID